MRRSLVLPVVASAACLLFAQPVFACGGLVAPNGAVHLERTTTLAAFHAGVEHYVTSFQYAGRLNDFGAIIPLPGVPTDVRRAGSWTLQRLERETQPPVLDEPVIAGVAAPAAAAQVLLQTRVDALDITVISGGGPAIIDWIRAHSYAVSPDAPAMIDFYASRSPVFLAARFDAAAARAKGQLIGDGTPVQITIPTPNPWVPLHILSLAKHALEPVQADVYTLTDRAPSLLGLDPGVRVQVSEAASATLLNDLRADRDSSWIPDHAWLTLVRIDTPAGQLLHDLAIDASGADQPSAVQAGYDPGRGVPVAQPVGIHYVRLPHPLLPQSKDAGSDSPIVVGVLAVTAALVLTLVALRISRRRTLDARTHGG
jgi:hypothetical protein